MSIPRNALSRVAAEEETETTWPPAFTRAATTSAAVSCVPVNSRMSALKVGLLPMALSHGIGSEVQRPLATVIIGGLVSATLLTLVVLPTLYLIATRNVQVEVPEA